MNITFYNGNQMPKVGIGTFRVKNDGDVTISNYANHSSTKVLVGPEQLNEYFNKFVFHGRIQYDVDALQQIMDEIESFN
ncbi:hypothetical protein [Staphylococcus felis]